MSFCDSHAHVFSFIEGHWSDIESAVEVRIDSYIYLIMQMLGGISLMAWVFPIEAKRFCCGILVSFVFFDHIIKSQTSNIYLYISTET